MRTTRSQQDKNQRALLQAAVDLMTQQGFEATTMKQIARAAGLGDATVYKYFPSKEKLVLGYYERLLSDALHDSLSTPGWDEFSLQERLQRLVDSVLDRLLPDREFVALTRGLIGQSPILLLGDQPPAKALLTEAVRGWLDEAQARGEIPPSPIVGLLAGLVIDYLVGVVVYWLQDDSDEFNQTTQLVDLSLGLVVNTLQSGVLQRLLDLGGFVLRSQLARLFSQGHGLLDLLKLARQASGAR